MKTSPDFALMAKRRKGILDLGKTVSSMHLYLSKKNLDFFFQLSIDWLQILKIVHIKYHT